MTFFLWLIRDRIDTLLRAKTMSLPDVAAAAGIAESTLRQRLNEPESFRLGELEALATVLGTDLATLVATPREL